MPLTLEKLLPLLAEKQGDRCWKDGDDYCVIVEGHPWPVHFHRGCVDNGWHYRSVVEYGVREAIAEHGWPWKLIQEGDTITAVVNPEPERPLAVAAGPNGAIAMVAAYLKALGVELCTN